VEWHSAVGAGIPKSEWLAHSISSNHQWDFQQRRLVKLIAVHALGREGAIPEAGKHQGVRRFCLKRVFEHGEHGGYYNASVVLNIPSLGGLDFGKRFEVKG